jgi:hypothetical protein
MAEIDPRGLTRGTPPPSLEDIEKGEINRDLTRVSRNPGARDNDDNPTRASAAVALKLAGASFEAIAKELQYADAYRARVAVERALAESVPLEDVDQLRGLMGRRLERLLQSTWRRAINDRDPDHLQYVRTSLAIIDRHARLRGLDSPQQVQITTPQNHEVQRWIEQMAAKVVEQTAEEADIIDAEIVEADPDRG